MIHCNGIALKLGVVAKEGHPLNHKKNTLVIVWLVAVMKTLMVNIVVNKIVAIIAKKLNSQLGNVILILALVLLLQMVHGILLGNVVPVAINIRKWREILIAGVMVPHADLQVMDVARINVVDRIVCGAGRRGIKKNGQVVTLHVSAKMLMVFD